MNDLSTEQAWLLKQALDSFRDGVPAGVTIAGSELPQRDQQVVRERLEQMVAGVQR